MWSYFDLQVNGYAGVDFNSDELTVEQLIFACRELRRAGVANVLATVITAPLASMLHRTQTLADAIGSEPEVAQVISGIHLEGPFISDQPGYVGAHPVDHVIPADVETCRKLCAVGQGWVRLVTLAPEADPAGRVIRFLVTQQIVVAAGHTNATRDQLRMAIDQGLCLFTHLGNGCPLLLPRHDNIINRVLSLSQELTISLIADGHHIPGYVLVEYLERIPDANIVIVSDSISAAGLGPGVYPLGGQMIEVDSQGIAWAADRRQLAGSTGVLPKMAAWLLEDLGFAPHRVEQWMSANPRRLIA